MLTTENYPVEVETSERQHRAALALRGRKGSDVWARYLSADRQRQIEYLRANGIADGMIPGVRVALVCALSDEGVRKEVFA